MKVAFKVFDRETAYVFLDPTNAPDEAFIIDFRLDGVPFYDAMNSDKCVWLQKADNSIRVVPRYSYDFSDPMTVEWPIPDCEIVLDKDDVDYKEFYG